MSVLMDIFCSSVTDKSVFNEMIGSEIKDQVCEYVFDILKFVYCITSKEKLSLYGMNPTFRQFKV